MRARARARPWKSLGQHWLTDRAALRRIVDSMEIRDDETVIEIGAGTGLLTGLLAERATRLIAVELDERLASRLGERFAGCDNVAVLASDVLEISPGELLTAGGGSMPYVVVGNLPYFIGTAIVRQFLEATVRPRRLVVTLQAEVAESVTAAPGRRSYLGVEVQTLAMAKGLFRLAPRAFPPPSGGRSAVVRVDVLGPAEVGVGWRVRSAAIPGAGRSCRRPRCGTTSAPRLPPSSSASVRFMRTLPRESSPCCRVRTGSAPPRTRLTQPPTAS